MSRWVSSTAENAHHVSVSTRLLRGRPLARHPAPSKVCDASKPLGATISSAAHAKPGPLQWLLDEHDSPVPAVNDVIAWPLWQ